MDADSRQSMLEMYVYESVQMVEQLEELLIATEQNDRIDANTVNEVFRIMHTIKGSSAMMGYDRLAELAHVLEDLFDRFRGNPDLAADTQKLTDHVLQAADFFKIEIGKAEAGTEPDGDPSDLVGQVRQFQEELDAPAATKKKPRRKKKKAPKKILLGEEGIAAYHADIRFEAGCEMENMRAFTVVHALDGHVADLWYTPRDILEDEGTADIIRQDGFQLTFTSFDPEDDLYALLDQTLFLEKLTFTRLDALPDDLGEPVEADTQPVAEATEEVPADDAEADPGEKATTSPEQVVPEQVLSGQPNAIRTQSVISVHINKLDALLDLVGEIVISEAMVTHNPDIAGMELDNFHKAARQLNKLTNELQDIVMSIRMVPVAATFHKMQRIVRDMTRKLGKSVQLRLAGEDTEVDKSIIDQLVDPLMHLIRNSMDHGIESPEERVAAGKPEEGTLALEARNAGSDVWISVRDDGKGMDPKVILEKAKERGLLERPESEYSDKDILSLILLPGFSTKDEVSEFSGRGVGMDVVRENIEKIGGSIHIDSTAGEGTEFLVRIPLTLAIIDGMLLSVGDAKYILPITSIRESFRPKAEQIITDSEGNEMMMLRGVCTNIVRLHRNLDVQTQTESLEEGILIVVEDGEQTLALFADALIGEQQVVVKPLPGYLRQSRGLAGCTILGDGSISLILDISGLTA